MYSAGACHCAILPECAEDGQEGPLPTYVLALRGRDGAPYLLTASAFVDSHAVPEEAVCRTGHARALRTDAEES